MQITLNQTLILTYPYCEYMYNYYYSVFEVTLYNKVHLLNIS